MKKYKTIIPISLILLTSFMTFSPCLKSKFLNWDDNKYVTDNTVIQTLSVQSLKNVFTSFFVANYQPATIISYMVDYRVFKLNPFGYHLTNLTLHVLNSLLVFWLIYLLSTNTGVSFLTAIVFGIHPLHVESVAWISERKDVLYALFFLATVICYWYYLKESRPRKYYLLSFILFIFSLLSKAMAVTLPLILFLVDYISDRKPDKRMFLEKIPFLLLSVILGVIAILGQHLSGAIRQENHVNLLHKSGIASYSVFFYLNKLLLPVKLSCLYPKYSDAAFFVYLLTLLIFILLSIAIILTGRYTKKIIFGWVFFTIALLPVLQFIPIGQTMVADRYVYIPALGIFYIFAECSIQIYRRTKYIHSIRILFLTIVIGIVTALTVITWKRCVLWQDNVALWTDVINTYPNATAYYGRGGALLAQKNYDKAFTDFMSALYIEPNYHEVYFHLGILYSSIGDYKEAIKAYNRGLKLNPVDAEGYTGLCASYGNLKQFDKAIISCRRALDINPNLASANIYLAEAYYCLEQYDLAIKYFDRAMQLGSKVNPEFSNALNKYRK